MNGAIRRVWGQCRAGDDGDRVRGVGLLDDYLKGSDSSCYCCCDASALMIMAIFGVCLLAGGCGGWRGRDDTHKNTHATRTARFVVVVVALCCGRPRQR